MKLIAISIFVVGASFGQVVGPTITGVFPIFSTVPVIQAGEWISIYGTQFACGMYYWSGNFPLSLGDNYLSVTINGKSAYLSFASDVQINAQAPDDTTLGPVEVDVFTSAVCGGIGGGTGPELMGTATVSLAQFAPSFSLLDARHVAGVILRSDSSGAYGGGTYDILGPTGNSLGYPTVAARAGDTVELFGVGFGPTNPAVPAGQPFYGAAPTTYPVQLEITGELVSPFFAGLGSAGLYQFNLTIPVGLGVGDQPLVAIVAGAQTQPGVVISLE